MKRKWNPGNGKEQRFMDPDVILRRLESALLNERQWEKKRTTDDVCHTHGSAVGA